MFIELLGLTCQDGVSGSKDMIIWGESPLAEPKMLSKWKVFVVPSKVWECEFHHILVCTGSCIFVYYMGGGKLTLFPGKNPRKVIVWA